MCTPSDIKVLVACEESQTVCTAFRNLGFESYSCDIEDQTGGHPEWHIKRNVLEIIDGRTEFETTDGVSHRVPYSLDLIIAHPPCTYMSAAGACRMYPKRGEIDPARLELAQEAKEFFLRIMNADCPHICIENPRPLKVVELPQETQHIQPYEYGEPWSKLTYLWLNGLPLLVPTDIVQNHTPYVSCGTSRNKGRRDKAGFSRAGGAQRVRSRTFPGIAKAMAVQWGSLLVSEREEKELKQEGGMYECFHCGCRSVIWDCDFSFDDYGYEGDGLIHECHCDNCGASITYMISFDTENGEEVRCEESYAKEQGRLE